MSDQRNLILAFVLCVAVLAGYQYYFDKPTPAEQEQTAALDAAQSQKAASGVVPAAGVSAPSDEASSIPQPKGASDPSTTPDLLVSREDALRHEARIPIETPKLHGSLTAKGVRIDDLTLAKYHETTDPKSAEIVLFSPRGSKDPYYAEFGWVAGAKDIELPKEDTLWKVEGGALTQDSPVIFKWDNGKGLSFERILSVDDQYMFTVIQRVTNTGNKSVQLYPYGLIFRGGNPPVSDFFILYEGPLGVLDGSLKEHSYSDLKDEKSVEKATTGGWVGFTDKYWLSSLIPDQASPVTTRFRDMSQGTENRYQIDFLGGMQTVEPGKAITVTGNLFAGAKVVELLDAYEKTLGVPSFDLAVDFGWFYFLTKPIFYALNYFNQLLGNFGLSILLLTVLIKLLFFPLANKSYRAMSRMKMLAPQIEKLKQRFGDDKMRLNQETMALYKKQKVNPMAGCLPMIIQIPVFFALYKVLFISLEMRHAPFYGWIHDLSAPDPTSIFNLFGLIPWMPPEFLMIGIWPLLMGGSMFLQQRLSPQPADAAQAKVMMLMPIIFTFLMARFPSGLVIYWTWNNLLSITQQWLIMRKETSSK